MQNGRERVKRDKVTSSTLLVLEKLVLDLSSDFFAPFFPYKKEEGRRACMN